MELNSLEEGKKKKNFDPVCVCEMQIKNTKHQL